jgi:hypothetical protein
MDLKRSESQLVILKLDNFNLLLNKWGFLDSLRSALGGSFYSCRAGDRHRSGTYSFCQSMLEEKGISKISLAGILGEAGDLNGMFTETHYCAIPVSILQRRVQVNGQGRRSLASEDDRV